jgi:L-asparaginase / beta-aspartyl-peptidase
VQSGIPHAPAALIHAGAGAFNSDLETQSEQIRGFLREVLERARALLEQGEDAVAGCVCAVSLMESFELFNAGHGSALCSDGTVEMSAAVMRGSDRAAGAVAGLRAAEHPVRVALSLLEHPEVLMIGEAADRRARERGVELRPNEFFVTARQRARLSEGTFSDRGTVGAVCLDRAGHLAAATSTGGIRGQPPGRVGDSPLIGAGTWADQNIAISCTGDGEAFIRAGAARYAAALIEAGASVEAATDAALNEVGAIGGRGGLIAVSSEGAVMMPFTTEAMPRGIWRAGGEVQVFVEEASG